MNSKKISRLWIYSIVLACSSASAVDVKVLDGLPGNISHALNDQQLASPPDAPQVQSTKKNRPKPEGTQEHRGVKAPQSGEDAVISRLEFREAKLVDVIRALADMSGLNIVATKEAADRTVTIFLQEITVKEALETVVKNSGLWYRKEKNGNTFRIMTTEEFQRDMVIYRDDETRIFNLLHPNPMVVASVIRDLFGARVVMTYGVEDPSFGRTAGDLVNSGGRGIPSGNAAGGARGGKAGGGGAAARNAARKAAKTGKGGATVSENLISEEFTPDQLSRLEGELQGTGDGQISAEALRQISGSEQSIYVTVNREHNLILVRTSDSLAMKEIERLIKEMDRPTPQVLLEMKVLELSAGDSFRQIFNFENNFLYSGTESQIKLGNNTIPTEAGSLIYNYLNKSIFARLELLEKNNQINTVSSPVLLASNNRPARVFVGEEWVLVKGVTVSDPVVNNAGQVVTPAKVTFQTEDRDVGNTLTILPKINADRTVTLAIQQDTSSVNIGAITLPPITVGNNLETFKIDSVKTATIEGTVIAKDGLTVAIGGLISTSYSNDVRKVPFFSDLPLVGELFKRKDQSASKKELMLLITPHIITNPMEGVNVTEDQMDSLPLEVEEW